MNINLINIILLVTFLVPLSLEASPHDYAIIIGQHRGGDSLPVLKYSHLDAKRFYDALQLVGSIKPENMLYAVDQSKETILSMMDRVRERVNEAKRKQSGIRSKIIFYYSGHADTEGLLINNEKISYSLIKQFLKNPDFTISIGILDSCYSGNIIALKGGVARKDFGIHIQNSNAVKGMAILASSSANQKAQEWDTLKSSLFTHYVVTGLKGAADTNHDKVVSVQELYTFTQSQVLDKTASTFAPSQNPSYLIHFKGAGKVVVANLEQSKSRVVFGKPLRGTMIIQNIVTQDGHELEKQEGKELVIHLPPGEYSISMKDPTKDQHYIWQVKLESNDTFTPKIKYAVSLNQAPSVKVKGGGEKKTWSGVMDSIQDYAVHDLPGAILEKSENYFTRDHSEDSWNAGFMMGVLYTPLLKKFIDGGGIYLHFREVFIETSLTVAYVGSYYYDRGRERSYDLDSWQFIWNKEFINRRTKTEIRAGLLTGFSSGLINYNEYHKNDRTLTGLDVGGNFTFFKNVWLMRLGIQVTPFLSLYADGNNFSILLQNWLFFRAEF